MTDFPTWTNPSGLIVTPLSEESTMDFSLQSAPGSSSTWPVTNKAIFWPFILQEPTTFVAISWMNGATVSGNVDVGIYDMWGNRKVSFGSTAQVGANVLQTADIADTTLAPGYYFCALVADNTTGVYWYNNTPNFNCLAGFGMAEMAAAFPLPATVTYSKVTNTPQCAIGMCLQKKLTI